MGDVVLEFQQVAVEGGHLYDSAIWQMSFRLRRALSWRSYIWRKAICAFRWRTRRKGWSSQCRAAFAFLGESWSTVAHDAKLAARAKIGRVFDEPGWISELDMDENITLSQRHHTRRTESAIRDEASELARLFSLPGLPQGRPSSMRAPDLRRAACVRALLGEPELLILERPTAGVYPAIMPALMAGVRSARSRGAAVLWTTDNWDVWNDPGIKPTIRCKMTGSQMSILPGE